MKTGWALAKAADEILEFVKKAQEESEALLDKAEGKKIDLLREATK